MDIVSFLISIVPIVWLAIALSILRMPAHRACCITLVITLVLSVCTLGFPLIDAGTAALEGVLYALWPICWLIIATLFTYNLTVHTGAFEKMKAMLCSISEDKRVLVLLIGWGFAAFMEGVAGFGTPVAIPASMLVGLGINPVPAIVGCLVMNSMTTSFGSAGIGAITLAGVSGVDVNILSADISVLGIVLVVISPFFLMCICCGGIRSLRGMVPLTLVASLSYAIPWFLAGHILTPGLQDIIGAACSMVCIIVSSKWLVKKPDPSYSVSLGDDEGFESDDSAQHITYVDGIRAWLPYILIFVLLSISSLVPPIKGFLSIFSTTITVYTGENPTSLTFSWISSPGTLIFVSAFIGGAVQGCSFKDMFKVLGKTLKQYWKTVATIVSVLAVAKIMGYSGMIALIAQALVIAAGSLYPLVAPVIGALGGFLTGSGTSTCVLFGELQAKTAASLGLSESWMAAANILGAGIGKMICPESIAIGTGAADIQGQESDILKSAIKYFAIYLVLLSAQCMIGSMLGF